MNKEKGNALFLILIAVALFAALSYAVTQSGRSGGGVDKEQEIITAAQITDYFASLQSAALRMTLRGTTFTNLDLGTTAGFGNIFDTPCTVGEDCLFSPDGGEAIWVEANTLVSSTVYIWSKSMTVKDLGSGSNDPFIMLGLGSANMNICQQINKGLGLTYSPVNSDSLIFDSILDAYPGEQAACFNNGAGSLLYYHVLMAR